MPNKDKRSTKRATGTAPSGLRPPGRTASRSGRKRTAVRHGRRTFGFSATATPSRLGVVGTSSRLGGSGLLTRLRLQALDLTASRAAALMLLCAMMALLIWFFVDERFYVYAAEVRGNSLVSAEEVYRAGGLHSMSIFYIDRQQVAQDIEHRVPSVAQVRVQCQLPGRVSVQIREQDVRYLWRSADMAFLVDGEGRILKVDDGYSLAGGDGAHAGLAAIQDLDNRQLRPGDQVDRVALNAAGRLHALLPEVQAFEYSAAKGISLSDARGWRVYFGDDQELVEKVATLQALLLKLAQEHKSVKVIDLRFVQSPCYQ